MKVYRDISNAPYNDPDYDWAKLRTYDVVILSSFAALGRVGERTLWPQIRALREAGVKVFLWTMFNGLTAYSDHDWEMADRELGLRDEGAVALTPDGDPAVLYPHPERPVHHLDPYWVAKNTERYFRYLNNIRQVGGATGLLLDFIDPLGKPFTPLLKACPAFALDDRGLATFDRYRMEILRKFQRANVPIILNGRGPQVEPWVWSAYAWGFWWEQFGVMWDKGPAACQRLREVEEMPRGLEHFLDPGTQPCWAQACEVFVDNAHCVEVKA